MDLEVRSLSGYEENETSMASLLGTLANAVDEESIGETLFWNGTQDAPSMDDSCMTEEEMQFLSFIAYGVVGPLIIVIGLVGNGLTISTFLGRVPVWSNGATYTYLKWLAIMDTGALVTAIPMEVRLSMPWRKLYYWEAFYQAHLELPVLNSFMGSSIFIVVCLTCMRFMALFQPSKFRSSTAGAGKNTKAQVAVLMAIALAVGLSAPLVMLKQVVCFEDDGICRAKENTDVTDLHVWKAFVVVSEGIVRMVPVILLTVLNIAMIFKFRSVAQRRRAISTRSNSRADSARAEERGKLILMSTIVLSFVCFNSPSAVLSMIYSESWENRRGFQIFRAISNDCELANFAVNFYAYFMCSTDFRQAFFASLPCELGKFLSRPSGTRKNKKEGARQRLLPRIFRFVGNDRCSNVNHDNNNVDKNEVNGAIGTTASKHKAIAAEKMSQRPEKPDDADDVQQARHAMTEAGNFRDIEAIGLTDMDDTMIGEPPKLLKKTEAKSEGSSESPT